MIEFIDSVIARIENMVGLALSQSFESVASFAPSLFALGILVYVFVVGLMMLTGMTYSLNKALTQVLFFIAFYAFATKYEVIASPLYLLVTEWISEFATLNGMSVGRSIVRIVEYTSQFCSLAAEKMTWGTQTLALVLLSLLILVPTLIMVGTLFMAYLTVVVIVALVIALLPILFIFGMFSPTRELLMSGLRQVTQYLILGRMSVLMLSFVFDIVLFSYIGLAERLTDSNVLYVSAVFGLLIYLLLVITLQLPNIASSIAGGLSTGVGNIAPSIAASVLGFGRQLTAHGRRSVQYRNQNASRITRNRHGNIRGAQLAKKVSSRARSISQKSTWREA